MSFPVLSSKTRSYLKATCVFECFTLLPWERPLATTLVYSIWLSLSLSLTLLFIYCCKRFTSMLAFRCALAVWSWILFWYFSLVLYAIYSYRSLLFLVSPGVTILLSLTVFLNLVAETLPQVSDAIPLLGMFIPIPSILCIPHSPSYILYIVCLLHQNSSLLPIFHELSSWYIQSASHILNSKLCLAYGILNVASYFFASQLRAARFM